MNLPASAPDERLSRLLDEAREVELPSSDLASRIAETALGVGELDLAYRWGVRVASLDEDYTSWHRAARAVSRAVAQGYAPESARPLRLGILGSYTTNQLVTMVELVARSRGIVLEVYEAGFNQYQQEILDPASGLYAFDPDVVVLAVEERAAQLPQWSDSPHETVDDEVARWTSLWGLISERTGATVVHTNFVPPTDDAFGHIGRRLAGARSSMLRRLNERLGEAAADTVGIVDCERLASTVGTERWFDHRYWHLAKQGVSLESLPFLAKHTVAVVSGFIGMARKCLVLDLDGTLWGGVIGEDGLQGIQLGHGPVGEAYVAFQEHVLALKERGVILAVCSKNDEKTARKPFEAHPDMRLKSSDFALIVANWEPKPSNLTHIARMLDISTDALVFVDDQPSEREAVRMSLPEVDVITLPKDPAGYLPALAAYPWFEVGVLTDEDRARTDQYRSRALAKQAQQSASSMEEFLSSLEMRAEVAPVDDLHLARVAQLVGKTNQFNLTTHRHTKAALEAMASDPSHIVLYLKLRDRFADHGLVSVCIAKEDGDELAIDSLLMSCRVISRTVEHTILDEVVRSASQRGCRRVTGVYIPSGRNEIARGVLGSYGFRQVSVGPDGEVTWELDVAETPSANPYIRVS